MRLMLIGSGFMKLRYVLIKGFALNLGHLLWLLLEGRQAKSI
jgi:hypothetical protein